MSERFFKQLNNSVIEGNITKDPVLHETQNGKAVVNFVIANNDYYTKDGEKIKDVIYYKITAWGLTAENIKKYREKGNTVIVSGKVRLDEWEKDGQRKSILAINAKDVYFR